MAEPVSQRQAAAALALPPATFRGLVQREPSLSACIVGTGPRGSKLYDLRRLKAAWAALQTAEPVGLSDRARHAWHHRARLWWILQAETAEVEALEAKLFRAAEIPPLWASVRAEVAAAARAWAALPEVVSIAGLSQAEARQILQRSIYQQQLALSSRTDGLPAAPPPTPPSIAMPADGPPPLWASKADLEAVRSRRAEVEHRLQAGDLVEAGPVLNQFSAEAMEKRDAWRQLGEMLALTAKRYQTPESVRTAALQALSAVGLI